MKNLDAIKSEKGNLAFMEAALTGHFDYGKVSVIYKSDTSVLN